MTCRRAVVVMMGRPPLKTMPASSRLGKIRRKLDCPQGSRVRRASSISNLWATVAQMNSAAPSQDPPIKEMTTAQLKSSSRRERRSERTRMRLGAAKGPMAPAVELMTLGSGEEWRGSSSSPEPSSALAAPAGGRDLRDLRRRRRLCLCSVPPPASTGVCEADDTIDAVTFGRQTSSRQASNGRGHREGQARDRCPRPRQEKHRGRERQAAAL